MKYLNTYKIFEARNYNSYSNRYGYYTGNQAQPGFSEYLYGFFKGMNDRFKDFDRYYQNTIAAKNISGQTIDTGLGWAIGTAGDLATSVAMKIFEPQEGTVFNKLPEDPNKEDNSWWVRKKEPKEKEWLVKKTGGGADSEYVKGSSLTVPKTDADVTPEHHRLLSNNFIKNDLPGINNDAQMQDYIMNFYKKAGTPPGKNKVADEAASNFIGSYFNKKKGVTPTVSTSAFSSVPGSDISGVGEITSALPDLD